MPPENFPSIQGCYIIKAGKALFSFLMDKPPLRAKLRDWMLRVASRDRGGLRRAWGLPVAGPGRG